MKIKNQCLTILLTIVLACLCGCSTPQEAYCIKSVYEDDHISGKMLSAEMTDKIIIDGNEITAPADCRYVIVDIEMIVKNGKWNSISDFVIHSHWQRSISFNQELTRQLTGFDVFKLESAEKQTIHLVFIIKKDNIPLRDYTFRISYTDKTSSGPFELWELTEEIII